MILMRKNTKGISYVELIIIMGMLAALMSLFSVSFSSAWRARASKAANSVDAILSQSKVNALSGQNNIVLVSYREKDDDAGYKEAGYYAELYDQADTDAAGDPIYNTVPYKSELIGNSRLNISLNDTQLEEGSYIKVEFDGKKGSVNYAGLVLSPDDDPDSTEDETKISFSFGGTYIITIYKLTGEHGIG